MHSKVDILTVTVVLVISLVSGFISIAQRIARGQVISKLWIVSEFMAAILCGYLMYDVYPNVSFPSWMTMPVMVALAAHTGGRCFQEIEQYLYQRYLKKLPAQEDPPNA